MRKIKLTTWIQIGIAIVVLVIIAVIALKFKKLYGREVTESDLDSIEYVETDDAIVSDYFTPLRLEEPPMEDGVTRLLMLGNFPLTDNADSDDSLCNIYTRLTGAETVNCGIPGSCVAMSAPALDVEQSPWDITSLPCIVDLLTDGDISTVTAALDAAESLGSSEVPAARDCVERLIHTDMRSVDGIVIMYDAFDCYNIHPVHSVSGPDSLDTYGGALSYSLAKLQEAYPLCRIIVMGPAYAPATDDNVHALDKEHPLLSSYIDVGVETCVDADVTYVDNFNGTVTSSNADQTVSHIFKLTVAGRELMAERLQDAWLLRNCKAY